MSHETKLLVFRDDEEIEVNVEGVFYIGEPKTFESPGDRAHVEFRFAYVDNKPFELTDAEIAKAEEIMLENIMDDTPRWLRKKWNL
jgi:hypothetical protein